VQKVKKRCRWRKYWDGSLVVRHGGGRVIEGEGIIETRTEQERVIARGPFMMVAKNCAGLLFFRDPQGLAGLVLIVVLREIARLEVEIRDLGEDAVLGAQLLLEPSCHV